MVAHIVDLGRIIMGDRNTMPFNRKEPLTRLKDRLFRLFPRTDGFESTDLKAATTIHDLKNLLLCMQVFSERALESLPVNSPAHAAMRQALRTEDEALHLCREALDDMRSGRTRAVEACADLSAEIAEVWPLLLVIASRRSKLRRQLASSLPVARIDPRDFRRILVNLVKDASDALPDGRGYITVRTGLAGSYNHDADHADSERHGDYVFLEVSDSGFGFPAETLPNVLRPVLNRWVLEHELGMASVFEIVRAHDGIVRIGGQNTDAFTVQVLFPSGVQP